MMAMHPRHYEVWDSTPTGADIVGRASSLPAALRLYLRTRKTAPGHTINLLVDEPADPTRLRRAATVTPATRTHQCRWLPRLTPTTSG